MGRSGFRSRDREERLDPVRWRRPGRGPLLRLAAVAVLLITAAGALWSRPSTCATATGAAAVTTPPQGTAAASGTPPPARGDTGSGEDDDVGQTAAGPAIPSGTVGVPVRLADPSALAVVHPGDRVDLLRLTGDAGPAAGTDSGTDTDGGSSDGSVVVAGDALVLDVTAADDPAGGGLLLALRPDQATAAVTSSGDGFAILIRPG
ncbi:hypothetical protein [Actinoplanes sp. NPDC051851]|uniref:hypothetical protein n=1 Tax=Actinoplanes sp. NPDC051851 TaxID=3154753 RepID=UPI0034419FF8